MRAQKRNTAHERDREAPVQNTLDPDVAVINFEHARIIRWFETVKFRKTCFGGVDEAELWKKLSELNELYEASLKAERARYDTILESCLKNAGRPGVKAVQASEADWQPYDLLRRKQPAAPTAQRERVGDG